MVSEICLKFLECEKCEGQNWSWEFDYEFHSEGVKGKHDRSWRIIVKWTAEDSSTVFSRLNAPGG